MILCEHAGIASMLTALGLVPPHGEDCGSAPTVVAWSPREGLLLRPEWAVLSLSSTTYVRLPLGLSELRAALGQPKAEAPPDAAGLCTPPGQLLWALNELRACVDGAERARRSVFLRHFCTRHWYGWFEQALQSLERAGADKVEATVTNLLKEAPWVAAYAPVAALVETLADSQGAMDAPLAALSAGVGGLGLLAKDDGWLRAAEPSLAALDRGHEEARTAGLDPDKLLDSAPTTLRLGDSQVQQLLSAVARGDDVTPGAVSDGRECLIAATRAAQRLVAVCAEVRGRLGQATGAANAS